ncbi:MAG: ComEC/Rec2 family competence protein, partial [Thermoanaerobacterium sp.]|nr:ComEC/Rec2 family competence protein [Thermoanaerobacterium sp.]
MYIAVSLFVGIIISRFFEINVVFLFLAFLVVLLASIYINLLRRDAIYSLLLAVFVLGLILGENALYSKGVYDNLNNKFVSFDGVVSNVILKDGFAKYVLSPKNKDKILITQYGGIYPKEGDLVEVRGIVELPQGKRNPGGFDYRLYLKKSGITALMNVNGYSVRIIKSNADNYIDKIIRETRERIVKIFSTSMPKNDADFVSSVILGQYNVEEDVLNSFKVTGLTHIIAVSGFNFGILTLFMMFILNILHIRRYSTFIIIPLLLI